MITYHLPALQVVIPLLSGPICIFLRRGNASWIVASLVSCLSLTISCLLLAEVMMRGPLTYAMGGWVAPAGIEYYVDSLTAFLLVIVNGVAALLMIGAKESIKLEIASDRLYLFYTVFLLNLAGLSGVVITGDAFNLFVFIEIASLSSYAMISTGRNPRCVYAAFRYLIFGTIGASFILISVGLLYAVTGTLNIFDLSNRLADVDNTSTVMTALIFFCIGIAIKASIFPLHIWLPDVYTYSPSIVSTFLAGTSTKVFIYVFIRFIHALFGNELVFEQLHLNDILIIIASVTAIYGSILAIRQDNLKRLLAYSSIAQIGYMLMGIALATELGLAASLAHLFNHAVIKVALFLSVTCIIYRLNQVLLSQLGGIAGLMPFTMACFVISGLSLIGVPLTTGFTSKWILIQASLHAGQWWLVVVIVISSILSILYIWKVVETVYFKPVKKELIEQYKTRQVPWFLYFALVVFVIANIYFGIHTALNIGLAEDIAKAVING